MSDDEKAPPLLIVEDDASALRQLRWTFDAYAVATAGARPQALESCADALGGFRSSPPTPRGPRLAALRRSRVAPETTVIVVTGEECAHALRAIELGAHDFSSRSTPTRSACSSPAFGCTTEAENRVARAGRRFGVVA
jgi:ActR/RegA family two-component response regulator